MCAVYIQYYSTDFSSRFVLQEHLYVIWYWYILILLVLLEVFVGVTCRALCVFYMDEKLVLFLF